MNTLYYYLHLFSLYNFNVIDQFKSIKRNFLQKTNLLSHKKKGESKIVVSDVLGTENRRRKKCQDNRIVLKKVT